ncbi:MAG: hypothetical protein IV100_13835, partial [Myxococcales bacterium]|nr:hypothetical protein [Myxococcales bacterium]
MMIRAAAITAAFAALWAFPAAAAETPLAALECDPVNEWVAAGAAPTVRTLANHHGWSAFEAVRGKDRRYVLSHPPDDGESTLPPWGNLDAPAEGACYLFRETVRTKVPKAGSFGPKGGTHSARVFVDESCSDESCAYLMVGLDASGTATSTVVLTTRVVNVERISVFDGHDSLLVTAETDAGAGYRHVLKAIVHDSGAG